MLEIKNALISVYDKRGIVEFSKAIEKLGITIFATGGTAEELKRNGVKVRWVAELTGFPEILGGKVKTLHPDVFARILATEEEAEKLGMERFELIVVNLYPPEEEPDIGGVSLIRAGVKAGDRTLVITHPEDYSLVRMTLKNSGGIPYDMLEELNRKSAGYVVKYQIENYRKYFKWDFVPIFLEKSFDLRYGTNPTRAGFFAEDFNYPADFEVIKGDVSLNNLYDSDSAVRCAYALSRVFPGRFATCIVKHGTPCGVAVSDDPVDSIEKAWESDSKSAYGGILAFSSVMIEAISKALKDKFLEVICAPDFDDGAVKNLMVKKARLIRVGKKFTENKIRDIRPALGGFLVEEYSDIDEDIKAEDIKPAYEFKYCQKDIDELKFAYTVVRFVKSNAVAVSSGFQTLGIGGGLTSRVDSAWFATQKFREFLLSSENKEKKREIPEKIYVASDGFFPFPDSIEVIHNEVEKIKKEFGWRKETEIYVVEPGGSIRDKDVVEVARKLGIKIFLTGKRCFRH